ncbi:unnamed protein product [Aphis gossypii]|uniref:Uncharacterized protein n=1 Tax=Aphis gossypii TaxID=80765 RepID=A0A9P0NE02_APHGO|nr:unnamed protein product [Aphis gossypii]
MKRGHTRTRAFIRVLVCVRVYSLYNLPFTRPFILLFFPSYFDPSVIRSSPSHSLCLPVSQNSSYFSNFCVNGFVCSPHSYYIIRETIIIISRISCMRAYTRLNRRRVRNYRLAFCMFRSASPCAAREKRPGQIGRRLGRHTKVYASVYTERSRFNM